MVQGYHNQASNIGVKPGKRDNFTKALSQYYPKLLGNQGPHCFPIFRKYIGHKLKPLY